MALFPQMERTAQTMHDAVAEHPPLDTCLEAWPIERQAEAGEAVEEMISSPGWSALRDAIGLRIGQLHRQLSSATKPLESPAEYEKVLGEIRGMERVGALVDGIVQTGEEAMKELRSSGSV